MSNVILTVGGNTAPLSQAINRAVNRNWNLGTMNVQGFTQPLGKVTGQASEFSKSLEAANARVVAFGASAGAIAAVKISFDKLISSTIEVEKSLADINSILDLSASGLSKFSSDLFVIANKTGVSFKNAAIAATEFSRQGLSAEETIKRTSAALTLARLSGMGFEAAVAASTAALNSFNKEALTTEDVVNRMAAVDVRFAVSTADLAEGLKRVGSTASDANVSFNEMLGLIAAVQQTTARGGAVIGNAFKTIFTRASRPETLQDLEKLGVTTRNAAGEIRPMTEILKDLADKYDRLGPSQKSATAEMLGGVYQINILKAAMRDLGQGVSVYDGALKAANNSSDEATRRLEKLNQTISGKLQQTFNAFTESAAKIGNLTLSPVIKGGLDFAQWGAKDITKNIDAEGIGGEIFRGILKGMGSVLAGPGVQLLTFSLLKLLQRLATFTASAAAEFFEYNSAARQMGVLQQQANAFLSKNPDILKQMLNGTMNINDVEKLIIEDIKIQNTLLREQSALAASIARNLQASGVRVTTIKPTTAAAGHIPNFNVFKHEENQARMLGASGGVRAHMSKGTIAGSKFVMNNQETEIPNFGRNGDSAVIPHYADGHVPNFAVSSNAIRAMTEIASGQRGGTAGEVAAAKAMLAKLSSPSSDNQLEKPFGLDIMALKKLKVSEAMAIQSAARSKYGKDAYVSASPDIEDLLLSTIRKDPSIINDFGRLQSVFSSGKLSATRFAAKGFVPNFANYLLDKDYIRQTKPKGMKEDVIFNSIVEKAASLGIIEEIITGVPGVGKSRLAQNKPGIELINKVDRLTKNDYLTIVRAIADPKLNKTAFDSAKKLTHISASPSLVDQFRKKRVAEGPDGPTSYGRAEYTNGPVSSRAYEAELFDLYGDKLSVLEVQKDLSLSPKNPSKAKNLGEVAMMIGAFSPFTKGHGKLMEAARKSGKQPIIGVSKGSDRDYDLGLTVAEKMEMISSLFPATPVFRAPFANKTSSYFEWNDEAYKFNIPKSSVVLGPDRLSGPNSMVGKFRSEGFRDFIGDTNEDARVTSGTKIRKAILDGDTTYLQDNLHPEIFQTIMEMRPTLVKRAAKLAEENPRKASKESRASTPEPNAQVEKPVANRTINAEGLSLLRGLAPKFMDRNFPSLKPGVNGLQLTASQYAGAIRPKIDPDPAKYMIRGAGLTREQLIGAGFVMPDESTGMGRVLPEPISSREFDSSVDYAPNQVGSIFKKYKGAFRASLRAGRENFVHPTDMINILFSKELNVPLFDRASKSNITGDDYENYIQKHAARIFKGQTYRTSSAMQFLGGKGNDSAVDAVVGDGVVEIKGGKFTQEEIREKFMRAVLENPDKRFARFNGINGGSNSFTEKPDDVIGIGGYLIRNRLPASIEIPEDGDKFTRGYASGHIPNFADVAFHKSYDKEFGITKLTGFHGRNHVGDIEYSGVKTREIETFDINENYRGMGLAKQFYGAMGKGKIKGTLLPQFGKDGVFFPQLSRARMAKSALITQYGAMEDETRLTVEQFSELEKKHKRDASFWKQNSFDLLTSHAKGYIPNFNAVSEAVKREHAAGIPIHAIRVGKNAGLVSSHNPSGLGVWNTVQETGLSDGISKARKAGIAPKTKGMARGFIPNFADDNSGVGGSMALGALAFILPQLNLFGKALKSANKSLEDAEKSHRETYAKFQQAKTVLSDKNSKDAYGFQAALTRAGVAPSSTAIGQAKQLTAMGISTPGMGAFQSDKNKFISTASSNRSSSLYLSDMQKRRDSQQDKVDKASSFQGRAMVGSLIASQVSGMIPQGTNTGKVLADLSDAAGTSAQILRVIPGPAGKLLAGIAFLSEGAYTLGKNIGSDSPKLAKELEALRTKTKKMNSAGDAYITATNSLANAFGDSSVSTATVREMQLKLAQSLADLDSATRIKLSRAGTPEEKSRILTAEKEKRITDIKNREESLRVYDLHRERKGQQMSADVLGGVTGFGFVGRGMGTMMGNDYSSKHFTDTSNKWDDWVSATTTSKYYSESRKSQNELNANAFSEYGKGIVNRANPAQFDNLYKTLNSLEYTGGKKDGKYIAAEDDKKTLRKLRDSGSISQQDYEVNIDKATNFLALLRRQTNEIKTQEIALKALNKVRELSLDTLRDIKNEIAIAENKEKTILVKIDNSVKDYVSNLLLAARLADKNSINQNRVLSTAAKGGLDIAGLRFGEGTKNRLANGLAQEDIKTQANEKDTEISGDLREKLIKGITETVMSKSDTQYNTGDGKAATSAVAIGMRSDISKVLGDMLSNKNMDFSDPRKVQGEFAARMYKQYAPNANDTPEQAQAKKLKISEFGKSESSGEFENIFSSGLQEARAARMQNHNDMQNQLKIQTQTAMNQAALLAETRGAKMFGKLPTSRKEQRDLEREIRVTGRRADRGDSYAAVRLGELATQNFGDSLSASSGKDLSGKIDTASMKNRLGLMKAFKSSSFGKLLPNEFGSASVVENDKRRSRNIFKTENDSADLAKITKGAGLGDIAPLLASNTKLVTTLKDLETSFKAAIDPLAQVAKMTALNGEYKDKKGEREAAVLEAKAKEEALNVQFDKLATGIVGAISQKVKEGLKLDATGVLNVESSVRVEGIEGMTDIIKNIVNQAIKDNAEGRPSTVAPAR